MQDDYSQLFSEKSLDSLARDSNFIKRSRKITASSFVKTLVFSEEDHEHLSLLDLKCDYFENTKCNISQEAIHKRFTPEAVLFLKELFSKQLLSYLTFENKSNFSSSLFTQINIKDSSKFKLPISFKDSYPSYGSYNKISSLMNIQYEYDILTGNWQSLELTKATRNDQADSKETAGNIMEGSLNIRDLGYITTTYLKTVENNEAYYLNRLPKIGVYQIINGEYKLINWQALDKKIKQGNFKYIELDVYLGKEYKLKSRMILTSIPEKIKKERIRKAIQAGKRTDGYQPSKEYKIKAGYNIFITNASKYQLTMKEVIETYKLRWQVELVFKTWKSNLKLHKVKSMRKERMECQLIAKFIWILLNSKILQIANYLLKYDYPDLGCSPFKFYKRAKKYNQTLMHAMLNENNLFLWFKKKVIPIIPDLVIEQRFKKETHTQILSRIFLG